jgi:hypothetical protein
VLGDTLANLDLRYTGGVGLGYTWVENSDDDVPDRSRRCPTSTRTYRNADPSDDYVAIRARLQAERTQFTADDASLVHGVEAFPSTERIERHLPALHDRDRRRR